MNPIDWANESFEVAEKFVYNNIQEGQALPTSYVNQANSLAEKQIVTAGYRLANLMMSLKPYKPAELFLQE